MSGCLWWRATHDRAPRGQDYADAALMPMLRCRSGLEKLNHPPHHANYRPATNNAAIVIMEKICGFIVLRKPEYATREFYKYNMRIGQKTYRGIDRLRWEDIELAYYDNNLPPSLFPCWEELRRSDKDFSGLKLLKSYEQAREVWQVSKDTSEILALWSPELAELKGAVNSEVRLEYLGLDCIALGEWSVLLTSVYAEPHQFHWAIERLNDNGLLTSEDDCNRMFRQYVELSLKDVVEPLADNARAESVKVFAPRP